MAALHARPSHSRLGVGVAFLALLVAVAVLSVTGGAEESAPHVVLISIDGLRPITYTAPNGVQVPTLRRLAAAGAYARGVISVFPAVTYPAHTTLISGVAPAVHGIYNNRILDIANQSGGAWYWYAREVRVPTLPQRLRAKGLRVAAIDWPVSVGLDADILMPEYAWSGHREQIGLLRALSRPSTLVDEIEAARGAPLPWPMTDAGRTEIAAWLFRTYQPHLLMLHLTEVDSAEHVDGPDSAEDLAATAAADRYVATMLDAIKASSVRAQTTVVVVSDHGFSAGGPRLELNTLFRRQGWLDLDAQGRIADWRVYFQTNGGSGFVFLKDPTDAVALGRVRALLDEVAADPANGVQRVMGPSDLRALGADPRASFAVDMRAGFSTGGGMTALLSPAFGRGGHGADPARADMQASLIMAGPLAPPVGDIGVVRLTQIAPTLAAWFGVTLSPEADRPLSWPHAPTPSVAVTSK